MIYLASDPHGDYSLRAITEYLSKANKDDLLILLGDVELNLPDKSDFERRTAELLASDKPIAFIDGNHENYPWINSFPVENWNGGKVHRLSKNVVHLMRGNIYTIEGKTFFALGGWMSSDGWKTRGLWFPEECPSDEEMANGLKRLEANGNKVDYILTHNWNIEDDETGREASLREFCKKVENAVSFKHWYFGHWHADKQLDAKHRVVYADLVEIE